MPESEEKCTNFPEPKVPFAHVLYCLNYSPKPRDIKQLPLRILDSECVAGDPFYLQIRQNNKTLILTGVD